MGCRASPPKRDDVTRAVFYGLGSDGTVGANKNSVKIIGENTPLFAQGYFVYDSKKSGAITVSHLRFSPRPIRSTYLIDRANFVACHQFHLLETMDVLKIAAEGATFLLNSPIRPTGFGTSCRAKCSNRLSTSGCDSLWSMATTSPGKRAWERGSTRRCRACFFALAGLLPREEAIDHIKAAIRKIVRQTGRDDRRAEFCRDRYGAGALAGGAGAGGGDEPQAASAAGRRRNESDFVNRVTAAIIAGRGDLLPVSAMPIDGTFPTGTAKVEKRSIAAEIPIWDPTICIDCGSVRAGLSACGDSDESISGSRDRLRAPDSYLSQAVERQGACPVIVLTIQVAPDDCTGCGVCVDVCPAKSKEVVRHKAINMERKEDHLERERANFDFFLDIPQLDRTQAKIDVVKGSQILEPLFEFSGACAGCGETPYLKLMSQLFGDRAIIANATGCSSIYGGNLPTTPWTTNKQGCGPAWCNSLFEDNAEFGLGIRLAVDQQREYAEYLLKELAPQDRRWPRAGIARSRSNERSIDQRAARASRPAEATAWRDSTSRRRAS